MEEAKSSPPIDYYPVYISNLTFEILKEKINWSQNKIKIFGKQHFEPRLTAWFGPEYSYSNIKLTSQHFPDFLKAELVNISKFCDFHFNAALLNFYRSGEDSMGWHSDNEPEIDQNCIAGMNFGGTRKLKFKNRKDSTLKQDYLLTNKSVYVMRNAQQNWLHAIPKSKTLIEPRINITFRRIIS